MASYYPLRLAVVAVVLAAMTAASAAYYPKAPPMPMPSPPPVVVKESCATQTNYFMNCLGRDYGWRCCGVVEDHKCLCELKMEAEVHCVPGRYCHPVPKALMIKEMNLPCMKNLRCKHA